MRVIEISYPVLREQGLTLDAVNSIRGEHEAGPVPKLTERIFVGGPFAVPVTLEFVADDPGLRAFVEREAHSTFHIVHMSVSFAAEPTAPVLDTATLGLRLTSALPPEPVAWSMTPLRLTDRAHIERRLRLGPQLKLMDVEFEQTTAREREETFLQAQRELRSDPAWEFRRTKTSLLYGSHRLVMVVRAGRGQPTGIAAVVQATVRRNLLRRYERQIPGVLALEAVV